MIKKLKIKFVLINMCLVGAVLIIVFSTVMYNTYSHAKDELQGAMDMALSESNMVINSQIGGFDKGYQKPHETGKNGIIQRKPIHYHVAVVLITKDENGQEKFKYADQQRAYINEYIFDEAVASARTAEKESGWLKNLGLFYKKKVSGDTTRIAFADSKYFETVMRETLMNSIILFVLGMITVLVVSVFLARMAVDPVKKVWQRQQQFVADASHELKTPLTVILANNDIMLSSESLRGDHKKWLLSTETEAKHMRNLIDDLLFLARSDENEGSIQNKEYVSLSEIVTGVSLQFEPVVFEAGAELESFIEEGLYIECDQTQMKQLVCILLDNAAKYTDKGGKVTLSLRKTSGQIMLEVNNTGSVIAKEQLEHIFERFYRTDKARKREGGYGLGLSIAKTIAEGHGGKIKVSSNAQEGTTFTVIL